MVISHNIPALLTHLNMKKNDRLLTAAMQRMATGVKINSAKDDAAGLAIANKLAYQVSGLNRASENATNGISMIQTAEGALNEVHNMLQRMRELSVQVSNGTLLDEDRAKAQTEINELVEEITATANRTEFNKIKLLNGEANRVSSSYYQNRIDKAIATALYISDNVPAGTLEYTITQPGLPATTEGTDYKAVAAGAAAVFTGDADLTAFLTTGGNPTSFDITLTDANGVSKTKTVDLSGVTTMADARKQIKDACSVLGLQYSIDANGAIAIATDGSGGQTLAIAGNANLLGGLGVAADASDSNVTVTDPYGPRVQPAVMDGIASTYLISDAAVTFPATGTISIYGVDFDLSAYADMAGLRADIEAMFTDANTYNINTGTNYAPYDLSTLKNASSTDFDPTKGIKYDPAAEDAMRALGLAKLSDTDVNGESMSKSMQMFINGQRIDILPDDSYSEAMGKVYRYCNENDIHIEMDDSGKLLLATRTEGVSQRITVSGDESLLNMLGMTKDGALGVRESVGKGGGRITINGNTIEVGDHDTPAQIKTKIINLCSYLGLTYQENTDGTVYLTSNIAGSKQEIYIGGSPAVSIDPNDPLSPNDGGASFLRYFGLTPTGTADEPSPAKGVDAVIEPLMKDEAGNPVRNFNSGMSWAADGNQITITGTGGQIIKLNLQVMMDYETMPPEFTFGDGSAIEYDMVDDGSGNMVPVYRAVDMELVVKSYGPIMLQIGQNYNMAMAVQIPKITSETMGLVEYKGGHLYNMLNMQTQDSAQQAIGKLDDGIALVSTIRSQLGAYQNRLEATIRSLDTAAENTESARSRIQDTDMAKEMTQYAQRNVMYQAGMAMLGQANQRPQQILSLLQ